MTTPDYIYSELMMIDEDGATDDFFRITDENRANWVVDKMLSYDERLDRLDRQYKQMRGRLEGERDGFRSRWLVPLRTWAEANQPKRGKTLHLMTGSLSFRRVRGGARIVDKAAVLEWARESMPSAIVSVITERVDAEFIDGHFRQTGEIPAGVEVQEERDEFYVRAPKGEEGL